MANTFLPDLIPNASDDERNPSEEESTRYATQMKYWLNSAFEEAKANHEKSPEIQDMQNALDYLAGLQWKGPQQSHRAKPVTNRTLSLFWETVGLLTDIRPVFEVRSTDPGAGFSQVQQLLNLLTKAWALENNFDMRLAFCVMFAMMTSSFAKVYWNPWAHGMPREPGDGDITFEALSPNAVMVIGADQDIQEAELVIHRKSVTLNYLRRRFPLTGSMVRPDMSLSQYNIQIGAPAHLSPQLFANLSEGMQRKVGNASPEGFTVYPKAELREFWMKDDSVNESKQKVLMGRKDTNWCYWVEPGKPLYPRGRVIAMANNQLLDDQPNPYWHGRFPFAMLRLYGVPWQFLGMSILKPIMGGQDVLNQVLAGILNATKKALSPMLIAPKNAFTPAAWNAIDTSRPNEKAQYSGNTPHKPEFNNPPQIPPYVLQAYQIVDKEMDKFSGASAASDAMKKGQVPSGDSIDKITFARNTPIRMMGRSIESFTNDVGRLFVPNTIQFYTAERRLELLGTHGLTPEDYDNKPGTLVPAGTSGESYARKFKFNVERGTMLNLDKNDKRAMAVKLRAMRDISRKQLFRELDYNIDTDKNDQELIQEAKDMAAAMPQGPPHKGKK